MSAPPPKPRPARKATSDVLRGGSFVSRALRAACASRAPWELTLAFVLAWLISATGCAQGEFVATLNAARGDAYSLDGRSRDASSEEASCPEVELQSYQGDLFRFVPTLRVAEPFAERLRRFEQVVAEVSRQHFGRAPVRALNAGAYVCRPIAHRKSRLSEHAFGNALDLTGFEFSAVPNCKVIFPSLPTPLCKRFAVRVSDVSRGALHGVDKEMQDAFWRELVKRLVDEGTFRSVIGPSDPNHRTHYHLDMAPYSHVNP